MDGGCWKGESDGATFTGLLLMGGTMFLRAIVGVSRVLQLVHHLILFAHVSCVVHLVHHTSFFVWTGLLCAELTKIGYS